MHTSICPNCGYVRVKGSDVYWCPACEKEEALPDSKSREQELADSAAEFFYNKYHKEHLK